MPKITEYVNSVVKLLSDQSLLDTSDFLDPGFESKKMEYSVIKTGADIEVKCMGDGGYANLAVEENTGPFNSNITECFGIGRRYKIATYSYLVSGKG